MTGVRTPLPNPVEAEAPGWLVARRYGVPASMAAESETRRAVGDWRGACAAAHIDVALDTATIRDRHGAEVAALVEEDLRALVPDLVRWHVPRQGTTGTFWPALDIVLATYAGGCTLKVRTPEHLERPQRLTLGLGPDVAEPQPRTDRWDTARYLWDARHTGGLLARLGGGDRTPFHTRTGRTLTPEELPATPPSNADPVALTEWVTLLQDSGRDGEAWAAAGFAADFEIPKALREQPWARYQVPDERLAMVAALRSVVHGTVALRPLRYSYRHLYIVVSHDGATGTARLAERDEVQNLPGVPLAAWRRFPDLELLRSGRLPLSGLHPLVCAALFPEARVEYQPEPPARSADRVPVRCRDQWHQVGWRDGHIDALSHDPAEARREQVVRSLGGPVPPCFTVTDTWRRGAGRLPRALRELRWQALCALGHGNGDAFGRLLEDGVDPAGIRDRRGRTPLHLVAQIGDPRLVRRLVAAGLDINRGDSVGRTPLITAVADGASAALVRALLDAGAGATLVDDEGASALHLLRCKESAVIVPWLVAAGLDVNASDMMGRTPILSLFHTAAPPEAFRALLDAGADVTAVEEYAECGVADLIDQYQREDLEFLVEAWKAAGGGGDD